MRYQQSFLTVIPHSKAGSSRVTHPSATKQPYQLDESSIKGAPFDLHVLSTPPAFILSQDQTLNKMVSKQPSSCSNQIIETIIIASKKFNVVPDQAVLLDLDNESKIWCFVFITLFNLQGARRSAQLVDNTTSFSSCQELFSSFFKLFEALSSKRIPFSCITKLSNSAAALVSDLIILPLAFQFVKNFFQIFQIFLKFSLSNQLVEGAVSSAQLVYQSRPYLSTLFDPSLFINKPRSFHHFLHYICMNVIIDLGTVITQSGCLPPFSKSK